MLCLTTFPISYVTFTTGMPQLKRDEDYCTKAKFLPQNSISLQIQTQTSLFQTRVSNQTIFSPLYTNTFVHLIVTCPFVNQTYFNNFLHIWNFELLEFTRNNFLSGVGNSIILLTFAASCQHLRGQRLIGLYKCYCVAKLLV